MFIEISSLPETLNIDNDSVFPLVYQGQTKKTTLNSLKEALNYFTAISYNKSTGQFTFTKVNNEDVVLSTDLNTSIKNVSLSNGILTFTQQDNSTISIDISIGDGTITKAKLAQALQNEIDEKYVKPSGGIPKTDLSSDVQASLGKADTAVQEHQDISGKEDKSNKVTEIDENSTDTQYPTAKLLYDQLVEKQEQIDELVEENSTLKKQFPTAHISTTSTQLTDSADGMTIEHVKIKGATEQVQYEGRNLWNENTQIFVNQSYFSSSKKDSNNVWTFTVGGDGYAFATSNKTLSAGTYTASATVTNGNFTILSGNTSLQKTFTLTEETIITFRVYKSGAVTGDVVTLSNVMIESGSTAHDWEPYVGRTAST